MLETVYITVTIRSMGDLSDSTKGRRSEEREGQKGIEAPRWHIQSKSCSLWAYTVKSDSLEGEGEKGHH